METWSDRLGWVRSCEGAQGNAFGRLGSVQDRSCEVTQGNAFIWVGSGRVRAPNERHLGWVGPGHVKAPKETRSGRSGQVVLGCPGKRVWVD